MKPSGAEGIPYADRSPKVCHWLVELQASRSRLVQATDAERRRIERDLHDGTQQRLISIAMSLGLLETKLPAEAAAAKPILRETRDALAQALAELRELTHAAIPRCSPSVGYQLRSTSYAGGGHSRHVWTWHSIGACPTRSKVPPTSWPARG
jgi:signal transduction histidine kinase